MDTKRFPELLQSIYRAVAELEKMFPGRHFTPDGHMVGSLGEALASHYYRVDLAPASAVCHDGVCDGRHVQVKATQGSKISISSEPEHLLVLGLHQDGTFTEHYNGPGAPVWRLVSHKPRQKNGQYQVSLPQLAKLMSGIADNQKLPKRLD